MKNIKNEAQNYYLTLTPTKLKKKEKRIFLTKYVFLVLIISLIMFIGTFIGIKITNEFPLSNEEKYIILNFLGFFFIAMFILINVWMIVGTFFATYSLFFIKEQKPSWKVVMIINSTLLFIVYCLSTLFFALLIGKILKEGASSAFDVTWLVKIGDLFSQNIAKESSLNFFLTFGFTFLWSIMALIFNIGERVLHKASLVEFNFATTGEILKNSKADNNSNNQEKAQDKEIKEEEDTKNQEAKEIEKLEENKNKNNNKENEETKKESSSSEWDFLNDNSSQNNQVKNSPNNINETKKEYDENDPNSIFG